MLAAVAQQELAHVAVVEVDAHEGRRTVPGVDKALAAFDTFTNGSEFMNASQLAQCLSNKSGTARVSQQAAQEIINEFDKDGDGLLSLEEFMDAMADM